MLDYSQISLIVSFVSVAISVISYNLTKKQTLIAHTPILLPDIKQAGNFFEVTLFNRSNQDTIQKINFELNKGKLTKVFSIKDEFLSPSLGTKPLKVDQDIDGSCFDLSYEGIVGSKINIKGRIHILNMNGMRVVDFQEVNFKLRGC